MSSGGRVTVTGSMAADQPWHKAASLGIQKAGVRNLVHSLDATLEPDGIRAVSVTVRGTLSKEGRVHARPRRRGAVRGHEPGRGVLAHRGALRGLSLGLARRTSCWLRALADSRAVMKTLITSAGS